MRGLIITFAMGLFSSVAFCSIPATQQTETAVYSETFEITESINGRNKHGKDRNMSHKKYRKKQKHLIKKKSKQLNKPVGTVNKYPMF